MTERVHIRLHPQGIVLDVARGTPLMDVLFAHGVEFPCGGGGQCHGCRVRLLEGRLPVSAVEARVLKPDEVQGGWRLACQGTAEGDVTLELAQWDAVILADASPLEAAPRDGLGIAADVGTTTVAVQLVDLATRSVLAVRSALNPQARYGADVMSRIGAAVTDAGRAPLTTLIRGLLADLIRGVLEASGAPADRVRDVALVGNTVMHHLLAGRSVAPLSRHPFESPDLGAVRFSAADLGWPLPATTTIRLLPCVGGHVGSDVVAGALALGLARRDRLTAMIDLGTNGEIVLGHRDRLIACSTAAGPAFEAAGIEMGMRAATGAISEVTLREGEPACRVIGNAAARGVCGSGLVDAAATFLDLGRIAPSGRLEDPTQPLALAAPVRITQTDIRELQLAKAAIAAGLRILLEHLGTSVDQLETIHLAGAFGNYVRQESAVRIGLLPPPTTRIRPAGNTALRGAKIALFTDEEAHHALARTIEHVSLHAHPRFQDIYVAEMPFPPDGVGTEAMRQVTR